MFSSLPTPTVQKRSLSGSRYLGVETGIPTRHVPSGLIQQTRRKLTTYIRLSLWDPIPQAAVHKGSSPTKGWKVNIYLRPLNAALPAAAAPRARRRRRRRRRVGL